ncbi:hypothetical protein NB693_21430 [Pantoea ananatis]|nr:hypothetical protein [Pantoea ananatis]
MRKSRWRGGLRRIHPVDAPGQDVVVHRGGARDAPEQRCVGVGAEEGQAQDAPVHRGEVAVRMLWMQEHLGVGDQHDGQAQLAVDLRQQRQPVTQGRLAGAGMADDADTSPASMRRSSGCSATTGWPTTE